MAPYSKVLAWEIPGTEHRRLVGYSPWGRKQSDMPEHPHSIGGEGISPI